MSELSKQARAEMRAKATRLAGADPSKRVDSSDWTPPEPLNTYRKTGARPVPGPKVYKHGGAIQIDRGPRRADRKPRATGGKAGDGLGTKIANAYVNRDGRQANAAEFGSYHKGGFKRGGATTHETAEEKSERTPRKSGGRTGKWWGGSMGGGQGMGGMGGRSWGGGMGGDGARPGGLGGMGGWGGGAGGWARPGIQNVNGATPIATPASGPNGLGTPAPVMGAPSLANPNPNPNGTIVPAPAMAAAPAASPNGPLVAPSLAPAMNPDYRALQLAAGSGFKRGGRAKRAEGGDTDIPVRQIDNMGASPAEIAANRPPRTKYNDPPTTLDTPNMRGRVAGGYGGKGDWKRGGRAHHAKGGRAKGKTNINIVIGHPGGQNQPPPSMMPGPIRPPMPIPVPAAGQGTPVPPMGGPGGPGGMMGAGGPPMGGMGGGPGGPLPSPLPMGRKSGGRAMAGNPPKTASSPRDMQAGAGSGLGRLEKASMQKKNRTR
jgi:hypothetical protein